MGQLVFQAALGGQVALAGPNTASSYTLNLPTVNGNVVSTGDTATVTNTMLATNVYTAPGTIGSGTANTGAFTSLSATSFTNTGTDTATKFIPTGSSVTGNGLYLPATNSLGLSTNGTNALYIDSSQNVGIGTTSPTALLTIAASSGTPGYNINYTGSPAATIAGQTANTSTGELRNFVYTNYFPTFYSNNAERMRIDSSGNLLVGTTSAFAKLFVSQDNANATAFFNTGTGAGSSALGLRSNINTVGQTNINIEYQGITKGSIVTNGSTTAFNTSSDYRLKDNIVPLQNALNIVQQLKPCTYTWKADGSAGQGFIAHELQEVVPDCVTGEKDATKIEQYEISPAISATYDDEGNELTPAVEAVMGNREVPVYQGIDTSFLVATLTAAIQEQQTIINNLTARIETLEGK